MYFWELNDWCYYKKWNDIRRYLKSSEDTDKKKTSVQYPNSRLDWSTETRINALHYACRNNPPSDIVALLIQYGGGKEIVMKRTDNYGNTALHDACAHGASLDVLKLLVNKGGKELVMTLTERYHGSFTALHLLCRNMNKHQDLSRKIALLLEVGDADELRRLRDEDGKHVLNYAKENNVSKDVKDLLTNEFHFWCLNEKWDNVRNCLNSHTIKADKKKELIFWNNVNGLNTLHATCLKSPPADIVTLIVRHGGGDIIMRTDKNGSSALHYLCYSGASFNVFKVLVGKGRKDLVMMAGCYDAYTALHYLCKHMEKHQDLQKKIELLLKTGDADELLRSRNSEGKSPLDLAKEKKASKKILNLLTPIAAPVSSPIVSPNLTSALTQGSNLIEASGETPVVPSTITPVVTPVVNHEITVPDMSLMSGDINFFSGPRLSGHYHSAPKTDANVRTRREKRGQCGFCGLQTHCLEKKGFLSMREIRIPLTIEGECLRGRCLICNPLPSSSSQSAAPTPTIPPSTDL